ncbi:MULTISPECIES: amino acid ABC transporter permease [Halomonadaceae]|uniref:Polar amino acid ABC transporter permease n=2 Tax=Halomonadaceae TaxID=28256 RepID=A0A8H9M6M2_9GAMM|nr:MULTISPECIES: amino acid ABC transporter permease [Halomonas]ATH76467.1 amino acid ABC transporter permease [Halomonas hydrothermalis]KHJ52262.1 polar amino acid ABC transporter permease [Halomonas hydrothermalis]UDM08008.1 amino acid ABC transporter permease [Halomonas sp. NyZ770]GGW49527.1 polar amino acid ABC transporter permease [Halomonas johnsoniae]GHD53605.1 polar amino acid ABC transporter permease [Halomonas hamiltonii]
MGPTLDFLTLLPYVGELIKGLTTTVILTVVTTLTGLALAVAVAYLRVNGQPWVRWGLGGYVEVIRNTPFIVQLFFIFFGLPGLGIKLDAITAAFIAMTLNLAAYSAEILRAGISATARGQLEAARALGMNTLQGYRHVVLVPAFARVYPSLISQSIIVMLGSAVVSQISVFDLTYAANFIQSRNFRSFEVYLLITLIYLLLAFVMRRVFMQVGKRVFAYQQGEQR